MPRIETDIDADRGDPDARARDQRRGRGEGLGGACPRIPAANTRTWRCRRKTRKSASATSSRSRARSSRRPTWSGIESEKVCYNAGYTNVHELIPWRTLTGRQQLYQDHLWMRAFGEGLCVYRPPVDLKAIKPVIEAQGERQPGDRAELHHAAPEMGHPLDLYRQSADADAHPRRADRVDQRRPTPSGPASSITTGSKPTTSTARWSPARSCPSASARAWS